MVAIGYQGTVGGFRKHGLREIRKAAMKGRRLGDPGDIAAIQRGLRRAEILDLRDQILGKTG